MKNDDIDELLDELYDKLSIIAYLYDLSLGDVQDIETIIYKIKIKNYEKQ